MRKKEYEEIILLIRDSMGIKATPNFDQASFDSISKMIIRSGLLLTVYNNLPIELQDHLRDAYLIAIRQSVLQEYEGELVLEKLAEAGMDCIALKGWELRKLYPREMMRQMADLDILVNHYDFEKIRLVMEQLEYEANAESTWMHDEFHKSGVCVEMHKRLTDDSAAIQVWEKGIWQRAVSAKEHIYTMSAEDFYIFHFVHMHKDFLNGSLGLRRIVDTWLLQKHGVDMEKVKTALDSFGMWPFHEKIVQLSWVLMGEKETNEEMEFLIEHAIKHGIYGTDKSYKAGRIAAMGNSLKKGKMKSWLAAVFLPYSRMKAQFPILEKKPFLLPVCWLKRIIRFLRGDIHKSKQMMGYDNISQADYDEMKQFFKAGGIT